MAFQKLLSILLLQWLIVIFRLSLPIDAKKGLRVGFYRKTCPAAEEIIKNTTADFILGVPSLVPPLIRLQFHDCFVRGCDASVLLNSTVGNQAEKDSIPNRTLRGFHIIDAVKSAVETKCPGVVSCADIIAIVARDAVAMINGPFWKVRTGRRDGIVSSATEVIPNLPAPFSGISQLKEKFRAKGLSVKDLAVLSGGHTFGISHCSAFANRLYNFTGKGDSDPTLDPKYVIQLKKKCKPGDVTTTVPMDPRSHITFDKDYYSVVTKRRGLFTSDAALLDDNETRAYVNHQANNNGSNFKKDFARSMVKLGQVGVLTSGTGEIRKNCASSNNYR